VIDALERIEAKHKGCTGCLNVGPCTTVKLARALDAAARLLREADHAHPWVEGYKSAERTLEEVAGE